MKSFAILSKYQLLRNPTMDLAGISLLLAIFLVIASCDDETPIWKPTPGLSGYVKLQSQSDHSGILVKVSGTERTAITNSRGYFSFGDMADGAWQLEAEYPYFETGSLLVEIADGLQQRRIRIVLMQQLQFWIGPADTVVSMTRPGHDSFLLVLDGYVKNVSDSPVSVLSISGCSPELFAIRSQDSQMTAECEARYGWLEPSLCLPVFGFGFEPGEVRHFSVGSDLERSCFEPGPYEVFWVLNDNGNHGQHFWLSDLNKSLITKTELLRPVTVNLVP